MFKNVFSSEGRIRRLEYGLSYLVYSILTFIAQFTLLYFEIDNAELLSYIVIIPAFIVLCIQGAKRCHDRGNSGWYQLIPFYSLWMLFGDSDYGPNEYGPNPKGLGNHESIDEIGKTVEI
ncbi:DUF805 domain-containing protein [Aestuariibaculum sp. YM273]|uniref:DUF805 domain-containing protein n=1 Tax=Aestuariibaculum sp. YM273 TaxID=3070659 RepID=UPI0027DD47AC|nr:DUF805 domain-containing protein [Aestuariibaculum sp. YM273]WMI64451.1 DUF805 domain-containing protein [Aestuariibaculum sp. YM273]